MHYYQFNIGEYAAHTRHLSPIEDIAYRRLLDLAYTTELPLIKDIRQLTRLINLRDYQQETDDVLKEFFLETDEGWINNRVIKEIERTGIKSQAAKNSAAIRWDKERKARKEREQYELHANALKDDAIEYENDATNNPIPNTHNQEPITHKQNSCAEPKGSTPEVIENNSPIVIELPLNVKGTFHQVLQSDVDEFSELYPAVDIIQEVRGMRGWCNSNPTKLKTKTGIKKFINSWLSKAQNNPVKARSNFNGANYGVKQVDGLKDAYMTFGLQEMQQQERLGYEIGR